MERPDLVIAKVIGQPIDSTLPTPTVVMDIADVETAEPGEDVYTWDSVTGYDDNTDTIYTAGNSGELVSNKKSPLGPTLLNFAGLQSDLAYVTVNEILNSKDQTALARKKVAITRGMDKEELVRVISLMLGIASQEVALVSGEDLYDGILKMVHKVEDYADNYVMLVGSAVSNAIDVYDKVNVDTFHYRIGIKETMANFGIKKIKIPAGATIKLDSGSYVPVLGAHSAIMIGLNSILKMGKPILFVRRKISPEIAQGMGINPDEAFRLVSVAQTPTVINNSKNILGYGVFGYENLIEAITNYKAICWIGTLA